MAVKKTFVRRGTQEVKPQNMKPNFIYATEYLLDPAVARATGASIEQWGIIQLDSQCKVRRVWNREGEQQWDEVMLDTMPASKLWPASQLEIQFAKVSDEYNALNRHYETMKAQNKELARKVNHYESNRWHKIAERLARFFS